MLVTKIFRELENCDGKERTEIICENICMWQTRNPAWKHSGLLKTNSCINVLIKVWNSVHWVIFKEKSRQLPELVQKLWNLFKKVLSQRDIPCKALVDQLSIDLPWSIQNIPYLLTTDNPIYQQWSCLSQCQPSNTKLLPQGGGHCISPCP